MHEANSWRAPLWRWMAVALLGTSLWSLAPVSGAGAAPSDDDRADPTVVVHLNTATETELQRLPGVGPARARAILELRERLGKFRRLGQLIRVRGIGRATFRKLRPMLTLDEAQAEAPNSR